MEDSFKSLPKGWVWTTVGEISQNIHYGYTESSSENQVGPKFLRITDIQNNSVDWDSVPYCKIDDFKKGKYLLKEGDLVFARTGATVGKSFLIRGNVPKAVFASYLIRIILDKRIHTVFISNFFQSMYYWSQIHKGKIGIGQPNVNAQILSRISIPLAPLPEQHRIVAKIEELFTKLDAGVEALNKIKAQLKRYRQAVLKYAFEGKLTQEWREANKGKIEPASVLLERIKEERKKETKGKYKELPLIDASELSELPEGWMRTALGEATDYVESVNPKIDPDKEFIYLDIASIDNSQQKITNPKKYFGKDAPSRARQLVKSGDILFSTVRTYLKNIAMVNDIYDGQIASTGFCVIRPLPQIQNRFIFWLVQTDDFLNPLNQLQRGTSYPAVRDSDVFPQIIPLPPFYEQNKIVEEIESRLSIADNMEKVAEQSLNQSDRLWQSILKRAFEGKLVPQDPTDEPAEKLLDRIKEEKGKREAGNRGEKKHRNKKSKQMELI